MGTVDAPPSDPVLDRYRREMRRRNARYFVIVGVLVAVVAAICAVVLARGEAAHASLHTVSPAPASVPVQPPSATQQLAWRTSDHVALGRPQWGGTVVTYSTHTVGGRDAHTGARTWSYTRSDRTLCTAAQAGGTTIAIYELHGNCDELTALDSSTGKRRWTRTLDMDGMPVNGRPQFGVTPYTLTVTTRDVVYAIDPVTGYNRWTYQRYGCRIGSVALGSIGALISQDCSGRVACSGVKFCGRGPQILLRDGSAARGDTSKPNPDQIKWLRVGYSGTALSADQVLTAVDSGGAHLSVIDSATGKTMLQLPVPGSGPLRAQAFPTTVDELLWLRGTLYALGVDGSLQWTAGAPYSASVAPTTTDDPPSLATVRITVAHAGGVSVLSSNDGHPVADYTLPVSAGDAVYPLGTGFLVSGAGGTLAYR